MADLELTHADTDDAIASCFPALFELRPHLTSPDEFVKQIRRQFREGFRLLAARARGKVVGVAGYRLNETLLSGRYVYVDDLVVVNASRSGGVGSALLNEVERQARLAGCKVVVLDTAVTNSRAQRFYFKERFWMQAFRFARSI